MTIPLNGRDIKEVVDTLARYYIKYRVIQVSGMPEENGSVIVRCKPTSKTMVNRVLAMMYTLKHTEFPDASNPLY
jgi:hypothetical protein